MGLINQIVDATDDELAQYLDHLGWQENPIIRSHARRIRAPQRREHRRCLQPPRNYTGPVLVHSQYSGVGKTILLKILLEEFKDDHQTVYIDEHNVTPYELASIVVDAVDVGKSSTKFTEQKIRDTNIQFLKHDFPVGHHRWPRE